ncbi:TPA: hypothetical protein QH556_003947 [Klebsiella variicola]|nr:hypothetical protein [Klebsiella pneumoniae]WBN46770.1 hypothetical protein KHV97_08175 [Klebsiella pneumoniae]HBS2642505.1 hypothetical protein [Klebsiella pneumoniae]HDS7656720.1 hypothetical protein [Klebsiella variicola]HDU5591838.1 hypothetical protein [Klebsiella variicola]
MMFSRDDLTISMYYASSTDAESGKKLATMTIEVRDVSPVAELAQMTQLQCVTDSAKKKTYTIGKQSISNGSDPLLIAIEEYWRINTEALVKDLLTEVMEFVAGSVGQENTWVGQYGLKVFENAALTERLPESVLQADGSASAG